MRQLLALFLFTPVFALVPPASTTTQGCPPQGTQTANCAWGNLDLWTISEAQPDVVSHGNIGNGLFHVAQTVDSCGWKDKHGTDSCGWKDKHGHHQRAKPTNRIYTIGNFISSGVGQKGCSLVWELAKNTTLSLTDHPAISVKSFTWASDWYWEPTWNKVMHPSVNDSLIGKEVGKVKNIHLGQEAMINTNACPSNMGDGVTMLAFIFEMEEGVRESAEVKFNFLNSNCGVIAGTLLSFNC